MKLTTTCLTIATAMSTAAAMSCISDSAFPWPYTVEPTCETIACAQEQAYANCVAASLFSPGRTCVQPPSMLKRDVDLVCASDEACFKYTDNSLLCMVQQTGEYHDADGGHGNAISDVYTAANGDVTTATTSTQSTSTATAKADDGTSTAPASASTKGTSAGHSETSVAAGTRSSGSSGSITVNAAPSQYTGGAVSRSSVQVALLAVAALPVAIVAI